jgi:hypothetical protein
MQTRTRIAGVLAATASAVAMMGAPAFASVGPVDNGSTVTDSGNYTYAPTVTPTDTCGIAIASQGTATATCTGGAKAFFNSFNTLNSYNQDAEFGF